MAEELMIDMFAGYLEGASASWPRIRADSARRTIIRRFLS